MNLEDCVIKTGYQSVTIEFNPEEGPLIHAEIGFEAIEDRYGDTEYTNFRIEELHAFDDNGDYVIVTDEQIEELIQIAKEHAE